MTSPANTRSRKRNILLWTGTLLGLLLMIALLLWYQPRAVFPPLFRSEPHLLLSVSILMAATQFLNALTPVVLLGPPEESDLDVWHRVRVFLAVQPLALVAPGRLSDFGTLPLLDRHYSRGALASSIVVDRLITIFLLLLLAPLALRFVWSVEMSGLLDLGVLLSLALVVSIPFLLINYRVRHFANKVLQRLSPSLLSGFGAHTELLLRTSKSRLLLNLGLTAIKILFGAAVLALLAKNVGVSIGFMTATWMSVVIQLATSIPVSFQGLGVAEGSLVLLFSANDLPGALALSISLAARVILLIITAAIYFTTTIPLISERFAKY